MDADKVATLNKSWDASLRTLRKAMGKEDDVVEPETDDTEVIKAKKKKKDDTKKAENDSQLISDEMTSQKMSVAPDGGTGSGGGSTTHGSEGMPDPTPMRKSLMDRMSELDNQVNVEPFLTDLVENLDQTNAETVSYMHKEMGSLRKSLNEMGTILKAQSDFIVANAELTKSMTGEVEILKGTPVQRSSILTKAEGVVQERFQKSADEQVPMSKAMVYSKMPELIKSSKLDINDATKIEGRLEKGLSIGTEYEHLFV